MSPDEDYPVKDYGDGTAGTYLNKCVTCGAVFIGHKRDPSCGAHRASGEGGSSSAPEGLIADLHERIADRDSLIALHKAERDAALATALRMANEAHRALTEGRRSEDWQALSLIVGLAPPQAEAKAPLARAAALPRPEGISAQAMVADAMEGELRRQIANLRESWIAARHVVFAAREVVACSEPLPGSAHAKLRDVVTAYDQRHHQVTPAATPPPPGPVLSMVIQRESVGEVAAVLGIPDPTADVVEIHAETILTVLDYAFNGVAMRGKDLEERCIEIARFVARASA